MIATFIAGLLLAGGAAVADEPQVPGYERGDFIGKVVITVEGDEIGVVRDVGYNAASGEPVAVVDVDAYIGIGEKQIAIPLSRLQAPDASANSITTLLTRQDIEAATEFSEEDFVPAE